jgi:hypothetical protein
MLRKNFKRTILLVCALSLVSFSVRGVHASYTFKVHNKTDHNIVKLLASSDEGKTYQNFDIGDGIGDGKTVTMEWSHSTDDGNCEWFFSQKLNSTASVSSPSANFCEKNLVLEIG